LIILKDLKKRIEGLKHAYLRQREEDRAWEIVDRILDILEKGCQFLDFTRDNEESIDITSQDSPFK